MIDPPGFLRINGITARQHRYMPPRLTARVRRHDAGSASARNRGGPIIPALLTSTSTRPKRSNTVLTHWSTSASLDTSPAVKTDLPPFAAISSRTCAKFLAFNPSIPTRLPCAANAMDTARPRPRPAPVTSATG